MEQDKNHKFVRFEDSVTYRGLESPFLFNKAKDELYELDSDGLEFVDQVDGTRRAGEIKNRELIEYAESEGLLSFLSGPDKRPLIKGQSPVPSLRYLELIVTDRCNLSCRHCYLGDSGAVDMHPELLDAVLTGFDDVQGLRLLISGGEPLLYPHLHGLGEMLEVRGFRSVLLTNGVLLRRDLLDALPVQEVQVSIDGLESGHDFLRGKGTFKKAKDAARLVRDSRRDLSVATMVHSLNLEEMDGLEELVHELGAIEWSLEAPVELGRWTEESSFTAPLERAAEQMKRGFGGSYHGSSGGFACGLHLAAVLPAGEVVPCGFYAHSPLGYMQEEGLARSWSKKQVKSMAEVPWCARCDYAEECAGGCRYRALQGGPDPLMCAVYGWPRGVPGEVSRK